MSQSFADECFCLQQLATLLITRQVIGNLKEAVLPYVVEKAKLMWMGVRIAESMSPDSLKQFAEQSADAGKKTDKASSDGDNNEVHQQVETRTVGTEEVEIVHSGLHLTQAEVEAAMKKVIRMLLVFYILLMRLLFCTYFGLELVGLTSTSIVNLILNEMPLNSFPGVI